MFHLWGIIWGRLDVLNSMFFQLWSSCHWFQRKSLGRLVLVTVNVLQSKPIGGAEWLESLRKLDLQEVIAALSTLPGVGPKVAACIALYSLDQHHAIPVDTHVWQIAKRHLLPELTGSSLTPKLCRRVAEAFISKYGKYAGWAQTLLFIAELPSQKTLLPSHLSTIEQHNHTKKEDSEDVGKRCNCILPNLSFESGTHHLVFESSVVEYLPFLFSIRVRYKCKRLRQDKLLSRIHGIEHCDITLLGEA